MKFTRTRTQTRTVDETVDAACSRCTFFSPGKPITQGACHRLPPSGGGWPQVDADDWCGEFDGAQV